MSAYEIAIAKETHPGFTIVCDDCKTKAVIVESDVGFSETSGSWGGVDLKCLVCKKTVCIWQA